MRQPRHYGGAFFCKGAPAEAQRSGFGGERTSKGAQWMPGERRAERSGLCEDERGRGERKGG